MKLFCFSALLGKILPTDLFPQTQMEYLMNGLIDDGIGLGKRLLMALVIFIVGRFLIGFINKIVAKVLEKRNVERSIRSFLGSFINIMLTILLIVSVVGTMGVETTSMAALLASAGVAVGMALSGNLQNFAGGLVILFLKPYKVGDVIEYTNIIGKVEEIQIFHTIVHSFDNKVIFIPNGSLNSGIVTNFNKQSTRRLDFIFGIEYDDSFERAQALLQEIVDADKRILQDPKPQIVLNELAASSVNILVRIWVKTDDYWDVNFETNQTVYNRFNAEGIPFAFPQLKIHQAKA